MEESREAPGQTDMNKQYGGWGASRRPCVREQSLSRGHRWPTPGMWAFTVTVLKTPRKVKVQKRPLRKRSRNSRRALWHAHVLCWNTAHQPLGLISARIRVTFSGGVEKLEISNTWLGHVVQLSQIRNDVASWERKGNWTPWRNGAVARRRMKHALRKKKKKDNF